MTMRVDADEALAEWVLALAPRTKTADLDADLVLGGGTGGGGAAFLNLADEEISGRNTEENAPVAEKHQQDNADQREEHGSAERPAASGQREPARRGSITRRQRFSLKIDRLYDLEIMQRELQVNATSKRNVFSRRSRRFSSAGAAMAGGAAGGAGGAAGRPHSSSAPHAAPSASSSHESPVRQVPRGSSSNNNSSLNRGNTNLTSGEKKTDSRTVPGSARVTFAATSNVAANDKLDSPTTIDSPGADPFAVSGPRAKDCESGGGDRFSTGERNGNDDVDDNNYSSGKDRHSRQRSDEGQGELAAFTQTWPGEGYSEEEIDGVTGNSPAFSDMLAELEKQLEETPKAFDKMLKAGNALLRTSEEAILSAEVFLNSIVNFAHEISPDEADENILVSGFMRTIRDLRHQLEQVLVLQTVLNQQTQASFLQSLSRVFKADVKEAMRAKARYDSLAQRYTKSVERHLADSTATSDQQVRDLRGTLSSAGIDCWKRFSTLRDERHLVFLQHAVYLVYLHLSYLGRGHHVLHRREHKLNALRNQVGALREEIDDSRTAAAGKIENDLHEFAHRTSRAPAFQPQMSVKKIRATDDGSDLSRKGAQLRKEGWLLKFSQPKGFPRWRRRWFVIADGRMFYRRESVATETKGHIKLMFATVRVPRTVSRNYVFEVVCANPRVTHLVQAESESDKRSWIDTIQSTTANLLGTYGLGTDIQNRTSNVHSHDRTESHIMSRVTELLVAGGPSPKHISSAIFEHEGNSLCADCGAPEPAWVSTNLGVTLCLDCAAAHRSLGTHISKVRSVAMDIWTEATVALVTEIGNAFANSVWESGFQSDAAETNRPTESTNIRLKSQWIQYKYAQRCFVPQLEVEQFVRQHALSALDGEASVATDGTRSRAASSGIAPRPNSDAAAPGTSATSGGGPDGGATSSERRRSSLRAAADATESENDDDDYPPWYHRSGEEEAVVQAVRSNDVRAVYTLICQGASVNFADAPSRDQTPLHMAADQGQAVLVELLLLNGAAIDVKDSVGCTAAHVAASKGHLGVLSVLADKRADFTVRDNLGRTPSELASARGFMEAAQVAQRGLPADQQKALRALDAEGNTVGPADDNDDDDDDDGDESRDGTPVTVPTSREAGEGKLGMEPEAGSGPHAAQEHA